MTPNEKVGAKQMTELFFWGGHGDVGGSERPEAGNTTLRFLLDELETRGIVLNFKDDADIPTEYPDVSAVPRDPSLGTGWFSHILRWFTGIRVRDVKSVANMHASAIRRYVTVPDWRPEALQEIKEDILSLPLDLLRVS